MEVIDNVNRTVGDDLKRTLRKGSRVSIASAVFSIYAYQELREELEKVDEFDFIFTSPTFVKERAPRERREFYIPQVSRERSIYGTEFEVRLRNELSQKAIARECADWIRRKVRFRANVTQGSMNSFMYVSHGDDGLSYSPLGGFTSVDLGFQNGNSISNFVVKSDYNESRQFLALFNHLWNSGDRMEDVTEQVLDSITAAYEENSPELIYFMTLYNIFNEFLEDISEDYLPREGVGLRESRIWNTLYPFQKDAVLAIINKLETYSGCILADSVGLGKTFTALAVIKYYECRNKSVLVLCPKKLSENWNMYRNRYRTNPLMEDRLRYDVLYHTDLSRRRGKSNGLDLSQIIWENYDLVVIDESHNFRNGGESSTETKKNRYQRLLDDVVEKGVETKVLMLSATPVNNRFRDLHNQLQIAFAGNRQLSETNLKLDSSIEDVFSRAQGSFRRWSGLPPEERTTDRLQQMLDFDFFTLLDSVTIARSRRHIERYYSMDDIGRFPNRLAPISLRPGITELEGVIPYREISNMLNMMRLAVYIPTDYLLPSKRFKYVGPENTNRSGREQGIRRLMSIALLKRLESSIHSFRITLNKVLYKVECAISAIESFEGNSGRTEMVLDHTALEEIDFDEYADEVFTSGKDVSISIADMDHITWKRELVRDRDIMRDLLGKLRPVTPEHDLKLNTLRSVILDKARNPINPGNRKVLIFSAFSDTADYLYEQLSSDPELIGFEFGRVSGTKGSITTLPGVGTDFNDVLTFFSPISKKKESVLPDVDGEIDILIGTDCISEGQNLQDCDFCINYDIHWNPVRIIQRFGRVDRIGSRNERIQLVNFWPDVDLDEYINLKTRVEDRMRLSILTSTGDDDPINMGEQGDLDYRKQQLKRLQEEVVDIEEMQSGVSILDLGLNEFRLDLLDYVKTHGDLERAPHGLHAVIPSSEDSPPGVIFVLRNINDNVNRDRQNRLHPFYMVYISDEGDIVCDHLSPKRMLDLMRFGCRGNDEPCSELCRTFNEETEDGRDMGRVSQLLSSSIDTIIERKEQSDLDSFLSGGDMSFSGSGISGLDDFELICFLVVR
ncbi:MAG: DEAD/DEAH box helicase family protein [Candidatus Methanomethylophilaceae archaeon]|nr:DEAD/DEAH box helicase family protein [Candidatus Methanomethylophilaceae archaeon]